MARTVGTNTSTSGGDVAPVADSPGDNVGSTVQVDEKVNPEAFAYEGDLEDAESDDSHVVYVGDASTRVLLPEDWERVGAKGERVVWNFSNDFRVPVKDFTSAQLDYLRIDGRFTVPDKK